jgi:acyl carrier protein
MIVDSTEAVLQHIVAKRLRVAPDLVDVTGELLEESGLDSIDVTGVLLEIEEVFAPLSLADADRENLRTLRDLAAYIDARRAATSSGSKPATG